MTNARVLELIEAYGADLSAWPANERQAARTLMEANPELFAAALAEAQALDTALIELDLPPLRAPLEARLTASAPMQQAKILPLRPRTVWPNLIPAAAAASVAITLGASLGMAAAAQSASDPADAAFELFALENTYDASEAE